MVATDITGQLAQYMAEARSAVPLAAGSPISRQVSRGTDVPVRIFSYSLFFNLAECVIAD
jgi:hypothetical protein